MAKKGNKYIEFDLEWLEAKAQELKAYVDANPFDKLSDRMNPRGSMAIATIEAQGKFIIQALKDYAEILEVVDKLREKEAAKVESRGKAQISTLAEEFLEGRK